jgi:hypothetical protein
LATRVSYPVEVKMKAIKMRLSGIPVNVVMDELGIRNVTQLKTWMSWYRNGELHRLEQPVGKQYSFGKGPELVTRGRCDLDGVYPSTSKLSPSPPSNTGLVNVFTIPSLAYRSIREGFITMLCIDKRPGKSLMRVDSRPFLIALFIPMIYQRTGFATMNANIVIRSAR